METKKRRKELVGEKMREMQTSIWRRGMHIMYKSSRRG